MLKKYRLLFALFVTISIPLLFGDYIPYEAKSFFYTISVVVKTFLTLILPFFVFSFLAHSLISLKEKAIFFIVMLLVMVATSNFTAIFTAYGIGSLVLPIFDMQMNKAIDASLELSPMVQFSIPQIIANENAIIIGILFGVFFAVKPNQKVEKVVTQLKNISLTFLKKCFMPILPLFILGFLFKLEHEDMLDRIFSSYGPVLTLIVVAQWSYIFLLYFIAAKFNLKKTFEYIKNIIPATITGFSTISSAATMPVTIACTERNLQSQKFAHMIIPATANIHTLGSALGITLTALATLIAFDHGIPSFITFLIFAFYYTMSKFAVAGIPGGVIIIISPLLESYLGFSAEMVGLITAVYLLFDPFGTSANVTCNGAFAIIFNRVYKAQEPHKILDRGLQKNA
ncbi:MAG: cation:dicarboxylate symporter family transporter [Alphaproteobacteria bacterium]|jgi:Na+/H+-dicarboxylate symporter